MSISLRDYANQREETTTRCLVCGAPEDVRKAVEHNEGLPQRERLPRHLVVDWAKDEHQTTITTDSIYRHMRSHV